MTSSLDETHPSNEPRNVAKPGRDSPVDKLINNVISKIESAKHGGVSQFAQAVQRGDVSGQIVISNGEDQVKTPYVNLKTKDLCLPQSYLMYLWAFMYGVFVIEERLQERLVAGSNDFSLEPNDDVEDRAWRLLNWSVSLVDQMTAWPNLPRPDSNDDPVEKNYAEKVNSLFVDAVTFVAIHEYAHLTQGHADFVSGKTTELAFERRELEKEADNFARDFLYRPHSVVGLVEALPILLLMSSCLMLISDPTNLRQRNHPDLDDRLLQQLASFLPSRPHDTDYARLMCILVFRLFLTRHNAPRTEIFGGFETTAEALDNVSADMSALKQ